MLSTVAAPVSWFTDILASAAHVFGWSSPLDLSEVTRAVQTIVPFSNNVDMPDGSMPLSLFARNKIEVLPGLGGTDIDEMSIDYVKTIPAYFATFNLSTADSYGAPVFATNAGYSIYETSITDNGRALLIKTPLSYLAQFFQYARGGIIYRFKICSTEFHSGRYAIAFTPYENNSTAAVVNFGGTDYVHREIIDLRMGCEFTFHVPYTSVSPYRNLTNNLDEQFGNISVYAINPLKAPATVAQTVAVLVEVCGAPDVEFAGLRSSNFTLSAPSAPQSNINFIRSRNEITNGDIGNSHIVDDKMLSARHCIGEKLLSLNSLLKHTDRIIPITQGTTALSARIDPFAISTEAYIGATQSDSPYKSDLYSMITSMYAMSRGSVRLRVFNNGPTTANTVERNRAVVTYVNDVNNVSPIAESISALTPTRWSLAVVQNQVYRGCVEVQTPPYHHTYARTNVNSFYGSGALLGDTRNGSASRLFVDVESLS